MGMSALRSWSPQVRLWVAARFWRIGYRRKPVRLYGIVRRCSGGGSELFADLRERAEARWPVVGKHMRRNKPRWTSTCEVSRSPSSATGGTQVSEFRR